ncbi:MAG: bifunctional demethylmenaquinone methyltransferase/2-methoxy-6-polyprenyl-1,4-benzoquinol methylase UbiE [Armatimonadota bacterium]
MAAPKEAAATHPAADILPAPEDKHRYVREMFDAIAPRYDRLNSILSLRLHHRWRAAAVRAAGLRPGARALDVCTGTGDLAFALAKAVGPRGGVDATDFSEPMLEYARRKPADRSSGANVRFSQADTQALPFPNGAYDAATVAFGIRNVADIDLGLREMARVVAPGGRVVLLEFNRPRARWFAALYDLYSRAVMPRIGGWISGRRSAYAYLPASVEAFHSRETLAAKMEAAGLRGVVWRDLLFGTVVLHVGIRK